MRPNLWLHVLAAEDLVVVVAEEEMETEEDEADSKRHHVVHNMSGAVCKECRLRRFFFAQKQALLHRKARSNIHEHKLTHSYNIFFI
jgi:hypothetical protein